MKLNTVKDQLVYAVSLAERITGKKESLPILSCLIFDASDKHLVIRATNLEAGIEITIPASVDSEGIIAVPAHIISQTVRSIGSDTVSLKEMEGNLSVESRGSKSLIKAVPYDEFPSLGGELKSKGFIVNREQFLSTIQSVSYAASPSMIRPELGSISLSIDNGTITAVATDSFRLAEKKVVRATKKESGDLLIPLKHAAELVYILERMVSDDVEIIADEAQCIVSGGGARFMSRLVEAQFPNYREVIPKSFSTEATILKADFMEVLRKARIFSGADQQVGFHLYPARKIFTATARSAEIGEMSDSIDAAIKGEDIDINFHIGYLSDCLTSITSDSITLGFAGPGRPLVIRGISDDTFMYLVMPLNR